MTIYVIGKVELSASDEVIVQVPCATVYDQRPAACADVPVTYAMTTEFGWMYASVMRQVLEFAPQVPVFTSLTAKGGREDCGL